MKLAAGGWQWFGVLLLLLLLAATLILGYLDVGASAKVLAVALLLEAISLFSFAQISFAVQRYRGAALINCGEGVKPLATGWHCQRCSATLEAMNSAAWVNNRRPVSILPALVSTPWAWRGR
ncbi:MAG: hypothetical protein JWP42_2597 [Pseudomonas sp.]|nr:hypothetical protein [Pseudomonas sp.]